jgi:hypothetical protein
MNHRREKGKDDGVKKYENIFIEERITDGKTSNKKDKRGKIRRCSKLMSLFGSWRCRV